MTTTMRILIAATTCLTVCLLLHQAGRSDDAAPSIEKSKDSAPAGDANQATSETRTNRTTEAAEDAVVKATNEFRKKHKLNPVKSNKKLVETARDFARYMAAHDEFSHTADGRQPWERAEKHGYDYCIVLENIAYFFKPGKLSSRTISQQYMTRWENSPPHRKNLMDGEVTQIGVGVVQSKETGKYFGVQMFGKPESAQFEFAIANRTGGEVRYKVADQEFKLPPRFRITHQRCRKVKVSLVMSDGKPNEKDKSAPTVEMAGNVVYHVVLDDEGRPAFKKTDEKPGDAKPEPGSETRQIP